MAVHILVQDPTIGFDRARLRRKAAQLLRGAGLRDAELSVALVNDDQMRELNCQYRELDKSTNVLSFAQQAAEAPPLEAPAEPLILGDVVISLPTARREAAGAGIFLDERLEQLLAHGFEHILRDLFPARYTGETECNH